MIRATLSLAAIALVSMAAGNAGRHIELVKSSPTAGEVLSAPPAEMSFTFSADLDFERTAVGMRGPSGAVDLSEPRKTDDPRVVEVTVEDELSDGQYTVSWTAAPLDDHSGRGRFQFTVTRLDARPPMSIRNRCGNPTVASLPCQHQVAHESRTPTH